MDGGGEIEESQPRAGNTSMITRGEGKMDAGGNLRETTEERKGRKKRYEGVWGELSRMVTHLLRHKIPKTKPMEVDWISDPK